MVVKARTKGRRVSGGKVRSNVRQESMVVWVKTAKPTQADRPTPVNPEQGQEDTNNERTNQGQLEFSSR
jgi:hypothetical protein